MLFEVISFVLIIIPRFSPSFKDFHIFKQTVNSYLRWVFLINLFSNIIYNPCEHIAWLGELKVINASDQLWYFYTNVAWAFGLFTSVLM